MSVFGHVPASPFRSPGALRELFVLRPGAEQLVVLDAGEAVTRVTGAFDCAWLPAADPPVKPDLGPAPPGVYAYVRFLPGLKAGASSEEPGEPARSSPGRHGRAARAPGQLRLLTGLLTASPRLRKLFGGTPEEFCERARTDRRLCLPGTELLAKERLVVPSELERYTGTAGPYDASG